MKVFVAKESDKFETRVALTPKSVSVLKALGIEIEVASKCGLNASHHDKEYEEAGAKILQTKAERDEAESAADVVLRVMPPSKSEIKRLQKSALHISFLDPFNQKDLLAEFCKVGASAISLEMIPRITLAQKMDAISSQANIAGYTAVVAAAECLPGILPMMMTPAGTISPAKVFVIGVGVAGLQAIATAKRMGARVTAFDTRAEGLEQAESLGARALRIDLGETGATEQGYAKELTKEQIAKQKREQAKVCEQSDIVICTAKLFGRKAPLLIEKAVVNKMARGSIIVDIAASSGGNVEGTKLNKTFTTRNGVNIIGDAAIERRAPKSASQTYSANVEAFIERFYDKEKNVFSFASDKILDPCLIVNKGKILDKRFKV